VLRFDLLPISTSNFQHLILSLKCIFHFSSVLENVLKCGANVVVLLEIIVHTR